MSHGDVPDFMRGMPSAMNVPFIPMWGVALVVALLAPFAARALGRAFDARAKARTARVFGSKQDSERQTTGLG